LPATYRGWQHPKFCSRLAISPSAAKSTPTTVATTGN